MNRPPERLPLGRALSSPDFWECVRPSPSGASQEAIVPHEDPRRIVWLDTAQLRALRADVADWLRILRAAVAECARTAWRRLMWRPKYYLSGAVAQIRRSLSVRVIPLACTSGVGHGLPRRRNSFESICGIPVVPLTLEIAGELAASGNAFLHPERQITARDCINYIHRVSVDYRPGDAWQLREIERNLWVHRPVKPILRHIERANEMALKEYSLSPYGKRT